MREGNNVSERLQRLRQALVESGYFRPSLLSDDAVGESAQSPEPPQIDGALKAAREVRSQLHKISTFLHDTVVEEVLRLDRIIRNPSHYEELGEFLRRLLHAGADFTGEKEFVAVYGELLSTYILCLYRSGSPGRESPIIRMILSNIARRKAIELDHARLIESFSALKDAVTIALITKRHALYVLATHGIQVLFRWMIDYKTQGNSPQALALQVANLLLKHGVRLAEVTDLVCGGGDIGTLPDGIYVLTEPVLQESWKRLQNSALNRGALVTWELRELLKQQTDRKKIRASLCNPLSFSTLGSQDVGSFLKEESRELIKSLKGYVKVTPLKSHAALLSEILGRSQDNLNLLVMALDGLFTSVVRKIGPRIIREMAAQDANKLLSDFDFRKIVDRLQEEGFAIPQDFALASLEEGTGVREICELLMIVESGKISDSLSKDLKHVVDSYAKQVAMVLEMASAGREAERPHFIAIVSMMAVDPHFQKLFAKIRNRIDNPFAPVMCLDSLEHEYLVANHLFELYVNVAGDRRLHFSMETRSMTKALQVLGSARRASRFFSFDSLQTQVKSSISNGTFSKANIILVGADNEDALEAISTAKHQGFLDRVVLIGNPKDIQAAL
ncbi:MAG: hypothetical protein FJY85_02555, partial [Deltaproteobacteria bacterium]|nr:hypothetical protein [Deltaproteobacteria bacterium]